MAIHWEQPNYMAMPETDGHGDTCGIDAMLSYLRLAKGTPMTIAEVDAIRQELINLGDFGGGMTMGQIRDSFHHFGVQEVKFVDFNASLNFAQFRSDLIAALEAHQCVLWETANAQALFDNQQGVQYHFVTEWGIDSNLGYLTANGDTYTALKSTTPVSPVWEGIGTLSAARPVGYIILPAVAGSKPDMIVIEENNGVVTGAHNADNSNMHLGAGFAFAVEQANLLDEDITLSEITIDTSGQPQNVPGSDKQVNVAVIGNRYLATYDSAGVLLKDWSQAAEVIQALLKRTVTTPDVDTQVNQLVSNVQQATATVSTAVAELQKDVASLATAQGLDK